MRVEVDMSRKTFVVHDTVAERWQGGGERMSACQGVREDR